MLFILIITIFVTICCLQDTSQKQLEKDMKNFKRLVGYDYIHFNLERKPEKKDLKFDLLDKIKEIWLKIIS